MLSPGHLFRCENKRSHFPFTCMSKFCCGPPISMKEKLEPRMERMERLSKDILGQFDKAVYFLIASCFHLQISPLAVFSNSVAQNLSNFKSSSLPPFLTTQTNWLTEFISKSTISYFCYKDRKDTKWATIPKRHLKKLLSVAGCPGEVSDTNMTPAHWVMLSLTVLPRVN